MKNEYKNKLGKTLTEDKFEALGLIDNNGMLTNTGIVFSDQGLFHSQVFCTRWLGLTMSEATDSKNFSGSLIKLLEQAETFVKNNTKSGWRIGNQSFSRINKYEYDIDSVREAILNGLAHRCYVSTGCEVHVDIYDDRLEVSSPGKMPGDELIQNLNIKKVKSVRRNETICSIFDLLDYMERRGSGLKRIYDSYQGFDMKPTFRSDRHFFEVTFPSRYYKEEKHKVSNLNEEEIGTEDILDLTDNEIAVLNLINLNKSITRKELSAKISKSESTIKRSIKRLKELKCIERVGTNKKGYWKVLYIVDEDFFNNQKTNIRTLGKQKPVQNKNMSGTIKYVYELISNNPEITYQELSDKLNKSLTSIKRCVKKLKKYGYINRVGTPRTGHWEILTDNSDNYFEE